MKTKQIRDIRIIIASALFLLVTAAKLLLPAQTEALRERAREAIARDYDFSAAAQRLGESVSDGALVEAISRLVSPSEETESVFAAPGGEFEPTSLQELRGIRSALLPESYVAVSPKTEAEPAPDAAPTATPTPEAVTAFLSAQAEFAGSLPENVCADMPLLPFDYAAPVAGYNSSGFGYRLHPLKNEVKFHYGTDFAVWSGTPVLAFADGSVSMVGWDKGYGDYVIIDHADGWQTLYAHLSETSVYCGQSVSAGQSIALSGDSGEVTGPHLHFELICGGIYYDPEYYLA